MGNCSSGPDRDKGKGEGLKEKLPAAGVWIGKVQGARGGLARVSGVLGLGLRWAGWGAARWAGLAWPGWAALPKKTVLFYYFSVFN